MYLTQISQNPFFFLLNLLSRWVYNFYINLFDWLLNFSREWIFGTISLRDGNRWICSLPPDDVKCFSVYIASRVIILYSSDLWCIRLITYRVLYTNTLGEKKEIVINNTISNLIIWVKQGVCKSIPPSHEYDKQLCVVKRHKILLYTTRCE